MKDIFQNNFSEKIMKLKINYMKLKKLIEMI